ncbi:DEAD-box ATP-dependent RNA helicase 42-like [Nasonia vitripennis]|uniref:Uncharacterized protein n=1 Tax=Nasonia vitripennis TaxID=7425 RepID=A0A7M7R0L5_NASVI|nr:DEAD-box ATP-dependent RNA helicase 42-like [Nasonia vitripennis]
MHGGERNGEENKRDGEERMGSDNRSERKERKEEIEEILGKIKSLEKGEERDKGSGRESQSGEREDKEKVTETERDRKQIEEMEWRIEEGERDRTKNNIIIAGWKEEKWDRKTVEDWIKKKLEVEVTLRKTWSINRKIRRIGVECRNLEEKGIITREKARLQGSDIFIDNDLTWKERRNKEKLREYAVKERKEGKEVKIAYNKLWINGV